MRTRVFIRGVLAAVALFCVTSQAGAADYYSVNVHGSKMGYKIVTITRFNDRESCDETAVSRNTNMDETWITVLAGCAEAKDAPADTSKMFARQPLSDPYIIFSDPNGYKNVVRFQDVPPVVIDALTWKWAEGLKQQGFNDLAVIMDPTRQAIKDKIDKAKAYMGGQPQPAASQATSTAENKKTAPKKQIAKKDRLYLKNGQVIDGNILEKNAQGVWFETDDGIKLLFTHDEIKKSTPA